MNYSFKGCATCAHGCNSVPMVNCKVWNEKVNATFSCSKYLRFDALILRGLTPYERAEFLQWESKDFIGDMSPDERERFLFKHERLYNNLQF